MCEAILFLTVITSMQVDIRFARGPKCFERGELVVVPNTSARGEIFDV